MGEGRRKGKSEERGEKEVTSVTPSTTVFLDP